MLKDRQMRPYIIFTGALVAFIVSIITISFVTIENPFEAQAKELDSGRLNDFNSISTRIDSYYRNNRALPNSLQDLEGSSSIEDPKTGDAYGYKKTSLTTYELCANFSGSSDKYGEDFYYNYRYDDESVNFSKGYDCIPHSVSDYVINSVNRIPARNSITYRATPTLIPTNSVPYLKLTKPQPNETLCLGEKYMIEWEASPGLDSISLMTETPLNNNNLQFIESGINPGAKQATAGTGLIKGQYSWLVGQLIYPTDFPSGSKVKIQIYGNFPSRSVANPGVPVTLVQCD